MSTNELRALLREAAQSCDTPEARRERADELSRRLGLRVLPSVLVAIRHRGVARAA